LLAIRWNASRNGPWSCELVEVSTMFLDSIDLCAMSQVAATFIRGYLPFVCWLEHQPPVSSCSACGEWRPPRSTFFALYRFATRSGTKLCQRLSTIGVDPTAFLADALNGYYRHYGGNPDEPIAWV